MKKPFYTKLFAIVLAGFCASCSSPGLSVQEKLDVNIMSKEALSIGIESSDTQLIVFYVVNNTVSDIDMLTWNTPFEQVLAPPI